MTGPLNVSGNLRTWNGSNSFKYSHLCKSSGFTPTSTKSAKPVLHTSSQLKLNQISVSQLAASWPDACHKVGSLTQGPVYSSKEVSQVTHTRVHSSRYSSLSLRSSGLFHTGNLDYCLHQDSTWDWQQAGYQNPHDASPPSGQNAALHIHTIKNKMSL